MLLLKWFVVAASAAHHMQQSQQQSAMRVNKGKCYRRNCMLLLILPLLLQIESLTTNLAIRR